MSENKEFKQLVRIGGADFGGDKPIYHQLTKIRGVGTSYSNMICNLVGISKLKKAGELSDKEIQRIEEAIVNPEKFGAPVWMVNRRKDPETGKDQHLTGSELKFNQDNDIKIMRKIRSYKGTRHSQGLPARGQRTKSNFRRNKGKVTGVKKKRGGK
ncbi:MAG: 30S ribosomal protein S13 [Nanoarchaeota archaeon]|nr:30S ribosomal protein S13 [Nanoarchaeota archaeon]